MPILLLNLILALWLPLSPAIQENAPRSRVKVSGNSEVSDNKLAADPLAPYREAALSKWNDDIRKLEQADASEKADDEAVLFIGSSSIRLWESMDRDLAPWKTIRRGFGGARFSDVAVFIERLVQPHRCQAIVFFVANDISGGDADKRPGEVVELCRYIVEKVRESHPQQEIFFIAITPSESRFDVWPQIQDVNNRLAKFCEESDSLHFIATQDEFLNEEGRPKAELFRNDQLHLNSDGYAVWTKLIKRALSETLTAPSAERQ